MARSHRRLATIAATGTLAGLATLAAAGSASAATGPQHAAPSSGSGTGTVCVVTALDTPVTVQGNVCSVIVVRHEGLVTVLLNDLL
jgi:hypothetical protein